MSRQATILLVEDNGVEALFYTAHLKKHSQNSIDIMHVPTLKTAVRTLDRHREKIDTIVLDLGLSDSDGVDTVKSIRLHEKEIPVVILTGDTDHRMVSQALLAGANDYLVKGRDDAKLLDHIMFQASHYRIDIPYVA